MSSKASDNYETIIRPTSDGTSFSYSSKMMLGAMCYATISITLYRLESNLKIISGIEKLLWSYQSDSITCSISQYFFTYSFSQLIFYLSIFSSNLFSSCPLSFLFMFVTIQTCASLQLLLDFILCLNLNNSLFRSKLITVYDNTILYNTMQYNTIQYNTIQYNTIQYNIIKYNTIQYNTIQYNTIQYKTLQYNTVQYNIIKYNDRSHFYALPR